MDRNSPKKDSAKSFLVNNKKVGFIILTIFVSLVVIILSMFIIYGNQSENNNLVDAIETNIQEAVSDAKSNLFPIFGVGGTDSAEDNFNSNGLDRVKDGLISEVALKSKLVKIESDPVSDFTIFDKPISFKSAFANKPKICDQRLVVVEKNLKLKEVQESIEIKNFQTRVRSMNGYNEMPDHGKLDEETERITKLLQENYKDFIYKKDAPITGVIDKETIHFLNLLCNFEGENPEDYLKIKTLRYALSADRQIVDYEIKKGTKSKKDLSTSTSTKEIVLSPSGNFVIFRQELKGVIFSEMYNIKEKTKIALENDITTLSFDSKSDLLFYGIKNSNNLTIKVYDPKTNELKRLADIPLTQWTIKSVDGKKIVLYSKPSGRADGVFLILDRTVSSYKLVFGPKKGLMVEPTEAEDLNIVSTNEGELPRALLINSKTKKIGDLQLFTFAEKCSKQILFDGIFCGVPKSIIPNYTYPDDWLMGKVKFGDTIVYKSLAGTTTKTVSTLEDKTISVTKLNVSDAGIYFIDENTGSLYSVEMGE